MQDRVKTSTQPQQQHKPQLAHALLLQETDHIVVGDVHPSHLTQIQMHEIQGFQIGRQLSFL